MNSAPKILCVELAPYIRENLCAVLKHSGYDAVSTTHQIAETLLRNSKFDLIVLSPMSEFAQQQLLNVADGAKLLVVDAKTIPASLLAMVAAELQSP